MTRRVRCLGLLGIALLLPLLAPSRAAADNDDPPGRVARLSVLEGSVSFEPAGTDDWVSAVVNRPLTTGDKLWTDRGSRAELHLGAVSMRLGSRTGFSFLNLNDNATQIRLAEGTARLRVKRLSSEETFEVDTPNLAFSILRPGTYRFNVNEAGDVTAITVRDGEGEVTGGGQYFTVRARETAIFSGTDQLATDFREMYGDDDFDRWCMDRDRREDRSASVRYVSPDVIGYEDLDDYGWWRPVPEYGVVWFPRVTIVGWAPYRYGHWVYVWPWGYTWIEDEPWGFAPFHYGRWVFVSGSWGWVPCPPPVVGVAYVRPVYAPALVAWIGGSHWSVSVGVGGGPAVGWFPLGPREVYVPSYPVSRTYIRNVNITNTTVNNTVINNYYNTTVVQQNTEVHNNIRYVNRNVGGAVTMTSQQTIASAQPVSSHMIRVKESELANSQVVATAPRVTPEKQAFLGAGQRASVAPPEEVITRKVVARTAPPSAPPSFEEQHAALQQNAGRPVPISHMRQVEDGQPAGVRIAPGTKPLPVVRGDSNGLGNQPYANSGDRGIRGGNQPGGNTAIPPASLGDRGERGNNPLPRNAPSRSYGDRPPEARPPIQDTHQPEVQRGAQPSVERSGPPQDQGRPRYDQPSNNSDRRRAYDERPQPQVERSRPQPEQQPREVQPRQQERPMLPPQQERPVEQPQREVPPRQQERPMPPPQQERPVERPQPQPQREVPPRQQERPMPPPQQERPVERPQPQPQERPVQRSEPTRPVERPQAQSRSQPQEGRFRN